MFELSLLLAELVDDEEELGEGFFHPPPTGDYPFTVVRLQQCGRLGVSRAGDPQGGHNHHHGEKERHDVSYENV